MYFIRTLIFKLGFFLITAIVGSLGLPAIFFGMKYVRIVSKIWAGCTIFLLRVMCGLRYHFINSKILPKSCIIASKHQSTFETLIYWCEFDMPAFVLKKQLLNLPVFGAYLKRTGMIAIDRKAGMQSIRQIIEDGKRVLRKEKRSIVIFPEGTRGEYGKPGHRYNSGVYALYKTLNEPVVPIALNTGKFWSNHRFAIHPGTATIKILPAIQPGLPKDEFMTKLHEIIETESAKL